MKISSICHLIKEAGIAPNDIIINLFLLKNSSTYKLPSQRPVNKEITPKNNEKINNLIDL